MPAYADIVALEQHALVALASRQYLDARQSHGQAILIAREIGRPRLLAALFNRLGQALEADGDVQQAVVAYEYGLKALAEDKTLNVEQALMSLSAVSKGFSGRRDLPVDDLYTASVSDDLNAAENDATLPVKLLINIGNAYLRQPQEDPALNAYRQALDRPEIGRAPILRGHALTHIAIIQRWRGDLNAAEATLAEAFARLDRAAPVTEKRRALAVLAGIQRDRGELDRSVATYQSSLALYAQCDDALGQGCAQAGLGQTFLALRSFDRARPAFDRAAQLSAAQSDRGTQWVALYGLARCQQHDGDWVGAAASLRVSLDLIRQHQHGLRTDEGKVTFLDSVQDVFDQLITAHLERARSNPSAVQDALAAVEDAHGQALRDMLGDHPRRRARRHMSNAMAPLDGIDRGLLKGEMAPGVPAPSAISPMAQMAQSAQSAQSAYSTPSQPRLPEPDEAVAHPAPNPPPLPRLVFHVLADRTAVFAVGADGEAHLHIVPIGRDALSASIEQLRANLAVDEAARGLRLIRFGARPTTTTAGDPLPALRRLFDALIAPLADQLPAGDTPVVVEPHGPLWLLPFAALCAPDGAWLADRWPMVFAPSADVLAEIRGEPDYGTPATLSALLVGNPTLPAAPVQDSLEIALSPLPGAESEARSIADCFPPERRTLLIGDQADATSVAAAMERNGIVHLATHGVAFADRPAESFVALAPSADSDGLLTPWRIMDLSLPCDLVALSACQTALGKVSGDGMIGLSRAFLIAGARSVLVSQWSVDDQATRDLMLAFYRAYLETDDKAVALQRAMRETRAQVGWNDPRYWAAFIVVGAEA